MVWKKTWMQKKKKRPLTLMWKKTWMRTWMRKKKKKKPAIHSDLIRGKISENHQDWSKLYSDILQPILESLSSIDFNRAKTVCSEWYSFWKTCVRQRLCPWQITYQGDASILFDPKEDKSHKTKLLISIHDSQSYCMASSGNWILLVDSCFNFYILNLLTRKGIKLPLMYSSILRESEWEDIIRYKTSAVLWINEKTKDYFVAWVFKQHYLFSYKKGYGSWYDWKLNNGRNVGFFDIAYKNNNLYLYTLNHYIKILDVPKHSPKVDEGRENPYPNHPFHYVEQPWEYIWKRRIVIRNSGEVLIILSLKEGIHEGKILFYVFKMNFTSGEWERVYSIGDNEMLIFGHGVTIKAPVQDLGDGIKSDSICFVEDDIWPDSDHPSNCGIFDLATSKITWPKRFGVYIDQTQWFIPGSA